MLGGSDVIGCTVGIHQMVLGPGVAIAVEAADPASVSGGVLHGHEGRVGDAGSACPSHHMRQLISMLHSHAAHVARSRLMINHIGDMVSSFCPTIRLHGAIGPHGADETGALIPHERDGLEHHPGSMNVMVLHLLVCECVSV